MPSSHACLYSIVPNCLRSITQELSQQDLCQLYRFLQNTTRSCIVCNVVINHPNKPKKHPHQNGRQENTTPKEQIHCFVSYSLDGNPAIVIGKYLRWIPSFDIMFLTPHHIWRTSTPNLSNDDISMLLSLSSVLLLSRERTLLLLQTRTERASLRIICATQLLYKNNFLLSLSIL